MGKGIRKQDAASFMASGFFRFALYACILCVIFFAGKASYNFGYAIFNQVPMAASDGKDITVVIKEGSSVYQIGKILEKKGLIEDAKIFVAQEKLSNYKGLLQPGTYILNTGMTADKMMSVLSREDTTGQPEQAVNPTGSAAEQAEVPAEAPAE